MFFHPNLFILFIFWANLFHPFVLYPYVGTFSIIYKRSNSIDWYDAQQNFSKYDAH